MIQWTDRSEFRACHVVLLLFCGLLLGPTHRQLVGAEDGLLPQPSISGDMHDDQVRQTNHVTSPATRLASTTPVTNQVAGSNVPPSFQIVPRIARKPASVASETQPVAPTRTSDTPRPDSAGPSPSRPFPPPRHETPDRPIDDSRLVARDSTALPNIPPQTLAPLGVPREIQVRARKMLQEGRRLAERGALFSAREEFLGVLQLIAQSFDAQRGSRFHSQALANGLHALSEADDFMAHKTDFEAELRLDGFVAGHKTPVLKDAPVRDLTPFVAMQRYYEYASEQLAIAANREPAASEALYAAGRAESAIGSSSQSKFSGPKSLALYQAALVVDPTNNAASNELGVLLARAGKLEEAASVLQHAVAIQPSPTLVKNLTAVNQRLLGGGALPPLELAPNHLPPEMLSPEMLAQRVQVQWLSPEAYSRQIEPTPPPVSQNVNLSRQAQPYGDLPPNQNHFPTMAR